MTTQKMLKWGFYIASVIAIILGFIPSITLPVDKLFLALVLVLHAYWWR